MSSAPSLGSPDPDSSGSRSSGPPRPPKPVRRPAHLVWHRARKITHFVCFLIFMALPFFNLMRFDIPHQRFYFLGQELLISEFAVLFFTLLFLLFVVATAALFYGRVYCGYLCPQMIFSEASIALQRRLESFVTRHTGGWTRERRRLAARVLFHVALLPAAVLLAFIFISYFVEPRDLLRRLLALDVTTAAGIAGAATTLLIFLDFAYLRLRFCTTICPYGYLQGVLSDDKSLHVCYHDTAAPECIDCKKCLKVCHMGIDIRTSPLQIECVHCGECIDACEDVMARLGKRGLIHYTWGTEAAALPGAAPLPWYRKVGLSDAKRVVLFAVVLAYGTALWYTLAHRSPVLVKVTPDRSTLFQRAEDGSISNHFRMSVANRGHEPARVGLTVSGLAQAALSLGADSLVVPPGGAQVFEFDVVAREPGPGVNPIRFTAGWSPHGGRREFPMTFIAPEGGASR